MKYQVEYVKEVDLWVVKVLVGHKRKSRTLYYRNFRYLKTKITLTTKLSCAALFDSQSISIGYLRECMDRFGFQIDDENTK